MNSSDICTQQRDREAKAFRAFLRVSLLGSAVLHGVVLTWVVSHQWGRSLQSQSQPIESQPIEVTVVKLPTSKPETPPVEATAQAMASGEPGAIEYLPLGVAGLQASNSRQVTESATAGGSAGSSTDLSANQEIKAGSSVINPTLTKPEKISVSTTATAPSTPKESAIAEPLTPEKPEDKPRSDSPPAFTEMPALTTALGSSSLAAQKPEDKPRSPSEPFFASIPALDKASTFNQPVLSLNRASGYNFSSGKKTESNPNDWVTSFRHSLSSFFTGTLGRNSTFAKSDGNSGVSSGTFSQAGVAVRSLGSSGSNSSASPTGAGATGLGSSMALSLNQGWNQVIANTVGADQKGFVVFRDPVYPGKAVLMGHTGTVRITINGADAHGNITSYTVTQSSHEELNQSAIAALKGAVLKPIAGSYAGYSLELNYTLDGVQVSTQKTPKSSAPASQIVQEPFPARQLLSPATRSHTDEPTAVHDLATESEAQPNRHSTVSPNSSNRPSPVSESQQATAEPPPPQPRQDLTPSASEESSTPGVANLEDAIPPASSNEASVTP